MTALHRESSVEHGSWNRVLDHAEVAVLAHYADSPAPSRSLTALLDSLQRAGFGVALISTAATSSPLRFEGSPPDLVVRRPNRGYDFGSWAMGVLQQPELARRRTLLMNDSMAGPFVPMVDLLARFRGCDTDVWGLVASGQWGWHIQSYMIGFAPGVLAEPVVRRFWSSVTEQPSKTDVIVAYELGQSRMLLREGFTIDVVVPPGLLTDKELNPAIMAWRRLLDLGIPLVKKQLIREPSVAPDGDEVADELLKRYGVEVKEWL